MEQSSTLYRARSSFERIAELSSLLSALEGLVVSVLLGVIGNLWYSSAYVMPNPVVQLVIARFITGFGAGKEENGKEKRDRSKERREE